MSYPATPTAYILHETTGRTSSGKLVHLERGMLGKWIRKENLPQDHNFWDYSEDLYSVVYTSYGLVLVCATDVEIRPY